VAKVAAQPAHRYRAGTGRDGSPRLGIPLQPLQLGTHVGGVLIPQFPVFLQRPVEDGLVDQRKRRLREE
jgi:hypothetical protein